LLLKNYNMTFRNSIFFITSYPYKGEGTTYILNHNKIGIAINFQVMNIDNVFIALGPFHNFARLTYDVEFGRNKTIQRSRTLNS